MHFMFNVVREAGYFARSLDSKDKLFEEKLGNGAMIITCLHIYLQNTVHTTVHDDLPRQGYDICPPHLLSAGGI